MVIRFVKGEVVRKQRKGGGHQEFGNFPTASSAHLFTRRAHELCVCRPERSTHTSCTPPRR